MTWFRSPAPRILLALIAGILWALAFPLFEWSLLAWIAPGMLLLTGFGATGRRQFWLGYFAGLTHHLIALYWLLNIPFAVGNVLGWLALSAYCALFPALWLWLCHRTKPRDKSDQPATSTMRATGLASDPYSVGAAPLRLRGETWNALREVFQANWLQRQCWMFVCAAIWVGLEFFRGWFLGGFPWNFLGASQFKSIPLIQIASATGVHGVSFVVVWVSLSLAMGAATVAVRPQVRFAWKNEVAPALIVLLFVISWGVGVTTRPAAGTGRTAKLALVQPSIPQTLIFDPSAVTNRFEQMLELTKQAIAAKPDLIIWPEASLPAISRPMFEQLRELIRSAGIPIILGSDDVQRVTDGAGGRFDYYNAALWFDGSGDFAGRYRKQRLVIFGEYTPGVRWLPFLARWSPAGEGFSEGLGPETFRVEPVNANVTVNICFEDNFSDLVRDQVKPDTDFVLNLTNNGWFGESAAQWQHAANAIFRAIENHVPLVRCTNNGLTCWIDEQGRLRQIFTDDHGSVYGTGVAVFQVPLLRSGAVRAPTIFARFGDWFAWLCLSVVGLACLPKFPRGPR